MCPYTHTSTQTPYHPQLIVPFVHILRYDSLLQTNKVICKLSRFGTSSNPFQEAEGVKHLHPRNATNRRKQLSICPIRRRYLKFYMTFCSTIMSFNALLLKVLQHRDTMANYLSICICLQKGLILTTNRTTFPSPAWSFDHVMRSMFSKKRGSYKLRKSFSRETQSVLIRVRKRNRTESEEKHFKPFSKQRRQRYRLAIHSIRWPLHAP